MKRDAEVMILNNERRKGNSQLLAAARAGMSERTARKYEKAGKLPSQLKLPRVHQTRTNPFKEDWPWVVEQLQRDPALQATTLFALLCEVRPDHYLPLQLRTLQRHIATWRALYGPQQEVIFAQVHTPGEKAQSDFTHMEDLNITLNGQPFPHLLYHFVLTYSNVEAVKICFTESFEALAEGIEAALWQIGGVPEQHRTDHLSAAIKRLDRQGREDFTLRYHSLMHHYGMQPTWNNLGVSHENGDVEQSHYRFKTALDQAVRVRGSREFKDRAAYAQFVADLVRKRNLTRHKRFENEQKVLQPLPALALAPCRELKVTVSRFSTIQVLANTYSVPSRLIGTALTVRLHSETLDGYVGSALTFSLPRLVGSHQHAINFRHLIWSLVRKPGAFAAYRYRDELFPGVAFRKAYDGLLLKQPQTADREYLRVLHLAATTSEAEVETALLLLFEGGRVASFEAVRELVGVAPAKLPALEGPPLNLGQYDRLLASHEREAAPLPDQLPAARLDEGTANQGKEAEQWERTGTKN